MAQASKVGDNWVIPCAITKPNDTIVSIPTINQFVDGNIQVKITTSPAPEPTLVLTDLTTGLDMGTATDGRYTPTVQLQGRANFETAGWIAAGNHTVSDDSVAIGTVNQSTMMNGTTTINSGTTVTPTDTAQTISISEGYNSARTLIIGATDSSAAGSITSGSANIQTLSYTYNNANGNFTVSGSGDVSAPTVTTPGYISNTKGTKNINADGATVNASIATIQLAAEITGTQTPQKPTLTKQAISKTGVTDAADGAATTTSPSSGVYVAVKSGAKTGTLQVAPQVTSDGYGTTAHATISSSEVTVGAAASDTYYIPITETTASVSGRTVSYGSGWITAGSTSVGVGKVTSGAATLTVDTPSYDSTANKFTQAITGTIAAPAANTAGYISSSEGTRAGNSINTSNELTTVKVGVNVSGTAKVTPEITRTAKPSADKWVDASSGAARGVKPTSGPYVQVNAAAKSSTLTISGKVTSNGYGTTEHFDTDAATSTIVGSNDALPAYIPIKVGSITSGTANITSTTISYNSTNENFDISGTANVSKPTINNEGYISDTVGSVAGSNDGATLTSTLPKIDITATLTGGTGGALRTPSISKHNDTNITASAATTTQPSTGYYVAVSSAKATAVISAKPTVTGAGYGTTVSGQYVAHNSSSLTVGANASAVTYIPIPTTTFANSATSGTTYTDISADAPILISGDYLYINAGYTPDVKISLAKLVPDASGDNAPAAYIRENYTAFDNNGNLIIGTMETYDGTYTIT